MKKKYLIIIILAAIAIIVALFFLLRKPKIYMEKTFKPTIEVVNGIDFDIDTTVLTIADKILNLDTVKIHIYYGSVTLESDDGIVVNTFAQKNPFPHSYTIFIGKNVNKAQIYRVLSHEMAHIKQYETGQLIPLEGKKVKYKGKIIDLQQVEYMRRPFEIDAFKEQMKIHSMLNRIVYE
jgi:hypothetical protein